MATIESVRCDYCSRRFTSVEGTESHEKWCEARPNEAEPGDICRHCNKREDRQETAFVHGNLEPETFYIHRKSGWSFPQYFQHRFRKQKEA